jgi:L-ascorbate metabolism protein UlaG (beta-lactamase superfamily)
VRLTWLGHSTVVVDVAGVRLLTDPLLRRHAAPLRRAWPQPDPGLWHGVDAVLLSHLHHDPAELASLRMLPGVPVLTLPPLAAWLRRRGLEGVDVPVGERYAVSDRVDVVVVPAEHRHRPMPHRPSHACGHLVDSREGTAWLAGDTELFEGLDVVRSSARSGSVDVAVVPVGGWGPRLSRGHLDPVAGGGAWS